MSPWLGRAAAITLLPLLAGCIAVPVPAPPPEPDRLTLAASDFHSVPGWEEERHAEALPPLMASCRALTDPRVDTMMGNSSPALRLMGSSADWRLLCAEAARIAPGDNAAAKRYFERNFAFYQAGNNGKVGGTFTGYFEPELAGSRTRSAGATALRGIPNDLVQLDLGAFAEDLSGRRTAGRIANGRLVPYHTRAEIEAGLLDGRAPAIAWVNDPIDAFFLHIQGSGRIRLPDGQIMRVGYAGQNGHAYVPIGRVLVERQILTLEQVSMQSIRDWLKANPDQAAAVMNQNPSYVFFRELPAPAQESEGPPGALGTPLTPMRSIAVDPRFVPLGVPVWVDVPDPEGRSIRRIMVAQDVGGAIRGPVRGDIFFGSGWQAGDSAGRMRSTGAYMLLLPRQTNVAAGPDGQG